jgi:hypothetical protein
MELTSSDVGASGVWAEEGGSSAGKRVDKDPR